MLKKLIHVVIAYGTRLGNKVIRFIIQYKIILLGLLLLVLSVIFCKVVYFGPELVATQIATKESENAVNNVTQQQRHEIECSAIRALLKKRNPRITLARLERELAKMTLPHEVENMRKIIECFKEKPGPNDKHVEDYIKNRKRGNRPVG